MMNAEEQAAFEQRCAEQALEARISELIAGGKTAEEARRIATTPARDKIDAAGAPLPPGTY
jgi:hypothetical protein